MSVYYNPTANRTITSSNYNMYIKGTLHPDRIMQEHDFVYILSGEWEIFQDDKAYTLYPNDVILLHSGGHHYGKLPCCPNTKTMYIHVSCDNLDFHDNAQSRQNELSLIKLDTVIHCQNHPNIKSLFQEIISSHCSQSTSKQIKSSILFGLLLCELSECQQELCDLSDALSEKMIQIFNQNPQKFFSSKELSQQFFLCEKTLNMRFKKVYHKSVYQYQMDAKLELVRTFLLNHPAVKLHDVASNFGFYDEFHLSKIFKKHYGVSPKKYKKLGS